jgi:acyl-CoA thioesterase I
VKAPTLLIYKERVTMKYSLYYLIAICFWMVSCTKAASTDPDKPSSGGTGGTGGSSGGATSATIVVIGSSTAAGVGASPSDSGWVNRLRLETINNKKTLYFVNLAVANYVTYQGMPNGYTVASRPAPDTVKNITKALTHHPSLVMITYPTNDIANGYTDDEIMANYKEMVRILDSAKVNYMLFGCQPRDFEDLASRTRLKTLNDKIKAAYSTHFQNVYDTLASADLTIKPELEAGDGTHLNNKGHYLIMESVLTSAIFQSTIK